MITATINDTPRALDVEGDMPVLWVLRDVLNLTGTKFGCGAGLCGAAPSMSILQRRQNPQ